MAQQGILTQFIETHLPKNRPSLGFGLESYSAPIVDSLKKGLAYADITLVGPPSLPEKQEGFTILRTNEPEKQLATLLAHGTVDGIIRGTIDDFLTTDAYLDLVGMPGYLAIEPGVFEDIHGRQFICVDVSNPAGWDKEKKLNNIIELSSFLSHLDIAPKVGVITGVRHETFQRKGAQTDGVQGILNQTYRDAEWVTEQALRLGIETKNYAIDSSVALDDGCNLLVLPNGMVGNQFYRALTLLGGGKIIAAPRIGYPHPFEDNSRRETHFLGHVRWLVAWINSQQ